MTFQAYLDNIKAKTGKTPEDFASLASARGLTKHGDIVKWLKSEFALGHGHATAIAGMLTRMGSPKQTRDDKTAALFSGKKQPWRRPCELLIRRIKHLGSDVDTTVGGTYISLLRAGRKFAILQPASADRLDIGIKLKDSSTHARLEPAGKWNAMVTHRVRIEEPNRIDAEVFSWLKRAYEAASQINPPHSQSGVR